MVDLESAGQDFRFVFAIKRFGLLKSEREPGIIEIAAGVLLELHAERRDDVEGGMEIGGIPQDFDHAPVIFERMKAGPRKHVARGFGIAILRLVHVPQNDQVDTVHEARGSGGKGIAVLHSALRAMRILDKYIVREIFRHALLGLMVFTFVFFVPQLVRLMELAVRHTGNGAQVLKLFLCIMPAVLTFTVPMAVLIGVLLGLGRMSADSEIIAMTALGIGRRRMLIPVAVLALTGALVTLTMTMWLGPLALRTFRSIEAQLISSQISFQVQPRVFDERFPRLVLYVNDVSASGTKWHGVFLAETGGEGGARLTLAEQAIVIPEPSQGKLELHMQSGTTHEFSREDADHYSVTDFGQSDWPVEVSGLANAKPRSPSNAERSTRELANEDGPGWREARVELHRRLAFPAACFVFALVAVPLGSQPRRGGRAAGSLIAVILIAFYYLLLVMGAGMARQGLVLPGVGIWIANASLTLLALILLRWE